MAGLAGSFNSVGILGNVSVAVGGNRGIIMVNPSNDKGSAFLHYLGYVRSPASNDVVFNNRSVASLGISVGTRHRGVAVIFRRFGLFGGGAILRGVVLTPICIRGGHVHELHFGGPSGLPGGSGGRVVRSTHRGTVSLLRHVKLRSGTSTCPSRLSNNRGRHITVMQTLTVGPSIVLFSRPASTLSPRVINRILRLVGRLTGDNVAVIIIARRVNFTHRVTSHILFVSNNMVTRRNAPSRVFGGPGSTELGSFLDGIVWGLGELSFIRVSDLFFV